ncbi:MAG: O-antigen ligase family protein [Candidatus Marinimicrobia bacterium]|nr:O-antigen ligase family protein [Candidatus Neomarinimicrobiota bacterium]
MNYKTLEAHHYFILASSFIGSMLLAFVLTKTNTIYAIAAAIGTGLVLATFYNTKLAIYILIFSMLLSPEFGSRTTTGSGFTIRIDDILLAIIVFTWIGKMAIYRELKLIRKTPMHQAIGYYMAVCVISTGLGMLRGDVNYLTGFFFLLKYFEYFVVFFMVYSYITKKADIVHFYYAILATFFMVVLVALSQVPNADRLTAPFEGEGGEPNTLGGYLLLIIAVNLSIIFYSNTLQKRWTKRSVLALTMLAVIPFLLTNSRGSWVAGIPVAISYMLLKKSRNITISFVLLMLVLSPFILPESVIERVTYTFREQQGYARSLQEEVGGITLDTSASERLRSWRDAFQELPKHMVFGFGITGWRFLDAQYMRVLIETGVVGFIVFLYLLYSISNGIWKIHKNTADSFFKALSLGLFIGMLGILFHCIGANTFIIIRIMEPFYLLCGMVFSIPKIEERMKSLELSKTRQTQNQGKSAL